MPTTVTSKCMINARANEPDDGDRFICLSDIYYKRGDINFNC
uniref:Uncharacterized protein n=1 Tax=viral metagenome TaxID=1070528 RepID=A0A6C0CZE5_9ZZZZ